MKKCTSCQSEIDEKAKRCPKCQSYQKWYANPQNYSWLFILPFMVFLFSRGPSFRKAEYLDHKDEFTFNEISQSLDDSEDNGKVINFVYSVKNNSELTWQGIDYQVFGKDKAGKVIFTNSAGSYNWTIHPKSESMLTVQVRHRESIVEWEFSIKNIDHKSW